MPSPGFVSITLQPGVNTEPTAAALRAGYAQSNLGRFRSGFFEKLGGWEKYFPFSLSGVPRALQAWLDLNENPWLGIGTSGIAGVAALDVIDENGINTVITPQTYTSSVQPNITTTSSSTTVTVTDSYLVANSLQATTADTIEWLTPISVDGLILSGSYPIITAGTGYSITAASAATSSQALKTITAITQNNPGAVTTSTAHGFTTGDYIYIYGVVGMTQVNGRLFQITSTGANSFTIGVDTTGYTAYTSDGRASSAKVPQFTPSSGSSLVTVTFQGHGLVTGNSFNFPIATTVGGQTVEGTYTVIRLSADTFSISLSAVASNSTVVLMNGGQMEILYYIASGPVAAGTGYGVGTYGSGTYGVGTGTGSGQLTGTGIAATDWTLDNWNATLMSCPAGGGIYAWTPNTGFSTAQLISGNDAPLHNSGIFVTAPRLALLAYGSTVTKDVGIAQDPLIYNISDIGDYTFWSTNVVNPTTGASSQAFQSRLPTGSRIVAGAAVQNQLLLWTDLDLYSLNYVNLPTIWTQSKIGSNCGTVSRHSVAQMSGVVYWRGRNNFHAMAGGAPQVIPCTVWDAIFQNQDTDNLDKCFTVTVTSFNEVWFFGPSSSSPDGNCDLYAKVNVLDGSWDYGSLPRSIGIDQSVVGNPVMATPTGILYSHESGYDADGQPLIPVMRTGYFYLSEGEDFVTADQFLPDFRFQTFDGSTTSATVQITFYVADSFTATPRTYGPYSMTTNTDKLDVRFRGRVCAFYMTSTDNGSFWRLGTPKMRTMVTGRR